MQKILFCSKRKLCTVFLTKTVKKSDENLTIFWPDRLAAREKNRPRRHFVAFFLLSVPHSNDLSPYIYCEERRRGKIKEEAETEREKEDERKKKGCVRWRAFVFSGAAKMGGFCWSIVFCRCKIKLHLWDVGENIPGFFVEIVKFLEFFSSFVQSTYDFFMEEHRLPINFPSPFSSSPFWWPCKCGGRGWRGQILKTWLGFPHIKQQ